MINVDVSLETYANHIPLLDLISSTLTLSALELAFISHIYNIIEYSLKQMESNLISIANEVLERNGESIGFR